MPTVNDHRETWLVTNNTSNTVLIGDLPNVPPIGANRSINLLRFHTKQEIGQSSHLIALVGAGYLSLIKDTELETREVPTDEAGEAVTSVEVDELTDTISTDEIITADTDGILIYGKDPQSRAQPIGVTGAESDEIKILAIDEEKLLNNILNEIIKVNMYMSIMTEDQIKNKDIKDI